MRGTNTWTRQILTLLVLENMHRLLRRCMAKREALGLPRVPVSWDFVHHTQAPDGQHRIQAREQKGQDLEDMEERLDGQENQGIVGAVLNEFVLKEVAT